MKKFVILAVLIMMVFAPLADAGTSKPFVKDIDHIAINVKDMAASIKFYRDILEFEQSHSVRLPDLGIDLTFFKLPGGDTLLELIHYDEANTIPAYDVTDRGILRHIAFGVDDVDAVADQLKKNGIEPHFGPVNLDNLGIRVILIKDPNNDVELEFCQPIPPQI